MSSRSRRSFSVSGWRASAPSRRRTRSLSSLAALRVNVRPRIASGSTIRLATSHATRAAIVSVLPDPAPATARTTARSGPPPRPGRAAAAAPPAPAGRRRRARRRRAAGGPGPSRRSRARARDRNGASSGHLPAGLLERAGAPRRAPRAVRARAHLEGGGTHALADLRQQLAGPGLGHRDAARQRLLVLFLGLGAGADLQQSGTAGTAAVVAEPARGDGDLVGGQLAVLLDVLGGRLAGLEVDDHEPAVGVALEPVDLAPDQRPAQRGVELDLDPDQFAT